MRALQRVAAIGIVGLVVAGCGSQPVAAPLTNTVTAVQTTVREVVKLRSELRHPSRCPRPSWR